jgi:hypothetical protein
MKGVFFHLSPNGQILRVLARTVKADVLVNCARIGFKP